MSDTLIADLGGAIVGAIITGLLSWISHRAEQTSSKKDELRKALIVLLDLRTEIQKLATLPDPQSQQFSGSILNNKEMIYLEAAENLVMDIPKEVSSSPPST
jgi:hypothetical protein